MFKRHPLLSGTVIFVLLAGAIITLFVLGQATDVIERNVELPPTSTPGQLFICEQDNGSRSATSDSDVCLSSDSYSFGEEISVTTANWGSEPYASTC